MWPYKAGLFGAIETNVESLSATVREVGIANEVRVARSF